MQERQQAGLPKITEVISKSSNFEFQPNLAKFFEIFISEFLEEIRFLSEKAVLIYFPFCVLIRPKESTKYRLQPRWEGDLLAKNLKGAEGLD